MERKQKRAERLAELLHLGQPTTDDFREMFRLALEMSWSSPVEAERYFTAIGELADTVSHTRARIVAHIRLSERACARGDYTLARDHADRVLVLARSSGDTHYECAHQFLLGSIALDTGQLDSARQCYERCVEIARRIGDAESEHRGLKQLGTVLLLGGDAAGALKWYRAAEAVPDPRDAGTGRAVLLQGIGVAQQALGHWEEATESLYRALAIAEGLGRDDAGLDDWARVLTSLGELSLRRDNTDKAIGLLEQVIRAAGEHEGTVPLLLPETHALLGDARLRQGDLARAEAEYHTGLEQARRMLNQLGTAQLHWRIAELEYSRERFGEGLDRAEAALAIAESIGSRPEQGNALRVKGRLLAAEGDAAGARDCFERALAALADLPDSYERALVRYHYGRFLLVQGERQLAIEHLTAAAESFRNLSVVREAEEINHLLMESQRSGGADVALVRAVSGLVTMGLAPGRVLADALRLVCNGAGYDAGAFVLGGRVAASFGSPDLAPGRAQAGDGDFVASPDRVWMRLPGVEGARGELLLERRVPAATEHNRLVLEAVVSLLGPALQAVAADAARGRAHSSELAGLRYRGVVGPSRAMREVLAMTMKFASAGVPVLVRGESGTGKELIARALHDSGPCAGGPFVAINCAAVPEQLLEAELFGVEKGAATGVTARKGKFELARGGTAFLDEIGDMSPGLQAKLLRVLQEKQFERVGGSEPICVEARVIAATNQQLAAAISDGRFRDDLYYRLNGAEIVLPPLRERRDDIPALVEHVIAAANREYGRNVAGIRPEALARLANHDWPGNVRELQHAVERAVVLAAGRYIEVGDLPAGLGAPDETPAGDTSLREMRRRKATAAPAGERERLLEALKAAGGSAAQAARAAGCSRAQFYRLLKKHGIKPGQAG
ncbi:MAG: sigma 54-interacting transcriptional regulator [bacterium]